MFSWMLALTSCSATWVFS